MYFPEILFYMETMNGRNTMEDLKVWLGYDHVFTVNPVNTWGGGVCFILEKQCRCGILVL